MKIIFDQTEPEAREIASHILAGHDVVYLDGALDKAADEVLREADIVSVFVSSPISQETLARLPNVRMIAARSMGYDHIDMSVTRERGITVATVPAYGVRTVAEFTFALILALSRKAYAAYSRLRQDGTTDVKHFEGFDLAGKTIGIIGTGNIGKSTARIARGFDMHILLTDARPDEDFAEEVRSRYVPIETLVAESDIVSLHVPLLPTTTHLVNADLLEKFKKGSYLINTARGGIVDTRALIKALRSGHLAGAGLDVIEGERALFDEISLLLDDHHDINEFQQLVAAHTLLDMPNVILTPHIAFNSREAKREIAEVSAKNILAFIAGSPEHTVA